MKLVHLSLLCGMLYHSSIAQVTISGNQYTYANSSNTYEQASPLWAGGAALIAQSGVNQTWTITDWESIATNVETFEPISDLSAFYQLFFNTPLLYPQHVSTHALSVSALDTGFELPIEISDGYTVFRNDEDGYYATGNGFSLQSFPIITRNTVVERIYPWPLTFGLEFTGEGEYLTSVPTFGAYGQASSRSGVVDGWGTLSGPFGSFDVLRVRTEIAVTDTLFIEQFGDGQSIDRPLQVDYSWISPEREGPILTISTINEQIISTNLMSLGINLSARNQLVGNGSIKAFPNPSSQNLSFTWSDHLPMNLQLFDIQGREVWNGIISPGLFDRAGLNAGFYLALFSRDGESEGTIKLVFTE